MGKRDESPLCISVPGAPAHHSGAQSNQLFNHNALFKFTSFESFTFTSVADSTHRAENCTCETLWWGHKASRRTGETRTDKTKIGTLSRRAREACQLTQTPDAFIYQREAGGPID